MLNYRRALTAGAASLLIACSCFGSSAQEPSLSGQIAFNSDRDGNWEIYSIIADGGHVTRLTNDPAQDQGPQWSPDGRQIAFTSDRSAVPDQYGNWALYVMDADGSHIRPLLDGSTFNDEAPS